MIKIELKIKDFLDWHPKVEMASQSCYGKLTRLNGIVDFKNDSISYEVIIRDGHNGNIIDCFDNLQEAIESYNKYKE